MESPSVKITRKKPYLLNGHPVIDKMPGLYMHQTANRIAVRIELDDPKSPTGTSNIYVHKNCVLYRGGYYAHSVYDVQLIDEDYILYRYHKDPQTGSMLCDASKERVPVNDVVRMMQSTQDMYYKKKERGYRNIAKAIKDAPRDIITDEYISTNFDEEEQTP